MKTSNDHLGGSQFKNIWPEEYRCLIDRNIQQVLKGDTCTFEARRLNGNKIGDWKIIASPVQGKNGKVKNIVIMASDITEQKQYEQERESIIQDLKTAHDQIKQLQGIIPICSHCKKIRDNDGAWNQLEVYLDNNSDAQLTHSICPECITITNNNALLQKTEKGFRNKLNYF